MDTDMTNTQQELEVKARQSRKQWRIVFLIGLVPASALLYESILHAVRILG